MTGPWQLFFGADHKRHLQPKDDIRQHRHSTTCWCNPIVDPNDERVMIHHSMDGREHQG